MSRHPLLHKIAASDCSYCKKGGKPYKNSQGKWAHEGGVLCQNPPQAKSAKSPEWDVTIRGKSNRTRVEKVQGQSYRDVEKRVKLGPGEQIQGMTVADKTAAEEDHKVATAIPQPTSPEDLDNHPFICVKCGQPFFEGAEGYVNKDGMPQHVKCGTPEELEFYKDDNNGQGTLLNREVFPAWYGPNSPGLYRTASGEDKPKCPKHGYKKDPNCRECNPFQKHPLEKSGRRPNRFERALGGPVVPRGPEVVPPTEKPGSVCGNCGRTVTEAEYSHGESTCCKAGVVAEEYGQQAFMASRKTGKSRMVLALQLRKALKNLNEQTTALKLAAKELGVNVKCAAPRIPDVDKELLIEHFRGMQPEEIADEVTRLFADPSLARDWIMGLVEGEQASRPVNEFKQGADEDNPVCICGQKYYDHSDRGDIWEGDKQLCSGFTPKDEPADNTVHIGGGVLDIQKNRPQDIKVNPLRTKGQGGVTEITKNPSKKFEDVGTVFAVTPSHETGMAIYQLKTPEGYQSSIRMPKDKYQIGDMIRGERTPLSEIMGSTKKAGAEDEALWGTRNVVVPQEFQNQVASALAKRGLDDFHVDEQEEIPHVVFFYFPSKEEADAAAKILRHDFRDEIAKGHSLWGGWATEDDLYDPTDKPSAYPTMASKKKADAKYWDTAEGAIQYLTDESSLNMEGATAVPDPSVTGVWKVTTKHWPEQAIVYLAGYRDPLGKIRERNDFEVGPIPKHAAAAACSYCHGSATPQDIANWTAAAQVLKSAPNLPAPKQGKLKLTSKYLQT